MNIRKHVAAAILIVIPSLTLAQRPAGTGTLTGRVMHDSTPVARALVTIDAGDGRAERVTATNDDGQFTFSGLPAGRYLVEASKHGWVTTYYGSPRIGRPPGVRVAVENGARPAITVPMVPGAVIAGRIIDSEGNPLPRMFPILLESRMIGDRRMIARVNLPLDIGFFEKMTDDRGEFRLFGLPPGSYYIVTTPRWPTGARVTTSAEVTWATADKPDPRATPPPQGPLLGSAPIYFPGTPDPSAAQAIVLGPGEVRDLTYRMTNAPLARVSGTVQIGEGTGPCAQVTLTDINPKVVLEGLGFRGTASNDRGFTINEVPPGEYRVTAKSQPCVFGDSANPVRPQQPPLPTVPVSWGQTTITVGGQDVSGVSITMGPASAISGRLVFDGTTMKPPADLLGIRLQFVSPEALGAANARVSTGSGFHTATLSADGTFRIEGLAPDRYLVAVSWPNMRASDGTGWWLASIRVGGRDLGDAPIDLGVGSDLRDVAITFRDRIGAVEGTLTDAAGKPAPEYFVMAFPVERASWSSASRRMVAPVRPGTDGHFRLSGLPAGEYYVAVVTSVGEGDATDPAFLELILPSAVRVTVADGETKRQDLKIAR